MIDYWLPASSSGLVKIDILTPTGEIVRSFSSQRGEAQRTSWPDLIVPDMSAVGSPVLTKNPGLNRVIWDLAYPGPWDTTARRSGREEPMVAPGTFTVRLTSNGIVQSQQLLVRGDPRATRDGITTAILREQLAHNLRVRDLTSQVNVAVAMLASVQKSTNDSVALRKLQSLQQLLMTPPIRYSEPGLQAHIQYLYTAALSADQKVGRDAQLRFTELKRQLDPVLVQLREVLKTHSVPRI